MWKCKLCGATVAPTASAVLAHFEKAHFSIFLSKQSELRRIPKAFLKEVVPGAQKTEEPKPKIEPKKVIVQTPSQQETNALRFRNQNMDWLIEQIKDIDRDHTFEYREGGEFQCPCCKRTMTAGKRLKHDRDNYIDICHDCFKAARRAITTGKK